MAPRAAVPDRPGRRDGDDAYRLGLDPACRLAVSQHRGTALLSEPNAEHPDGRPHAPDSQPTLSRLLATRAKDGKPRHRRTHVLRGVLSHYCTTSARAEPRA
ncbi:MAG: hypothetical protein HRF50_01250 [Phycisphaerae bacterium]